jgi:hypothetical protein
VFVEILQRVGHGHPGAGEVRGRRQRDGPAVTRLHRPRGAVDDGEARGIDTRSDGFELREEFGTAPLGGDGDGLLPGREPVRERSDAEFAFPGHRRAATEDARPRVETFDR